MCGSHGLIEPRVCSTSSTPNASVHQGNERADSRASILVGPTGSGFYDLLFPCKQLSQFSLLRCTGASKVDNQLDLVLYTPSVPLNNLGLVR